MSEAERVGSGCERRSTTVRLSGRAITHTDGGHMAKKKRATKKKAAKRSTKKRATKKKKVARKKKK
jgi:hypothetical protein